MAHYRMLDRFPAVVITKDRNELKMYDGNIVYLNDGDNFELRFFNPLPEKIGVEIIFNGIKKGDSFLVLNPGQDVILDRFLDEQRKMLFETYTIDGGNSAAVEAIAQNGIINFNFYKEKKSYPIYKSPLNSNSKPENIKLKSSSFNDWNKTNKNSKIYEDNHTSNWSMDYLGTANAVSTTTTTTDSYFSYVGLDLGDVTTGNISNNYLNLKQDSINMVETGRIEMGDVSSQELKTVELQFDTIPFHTITYKMIPFSNKPKEIAEIRQYCPECGYRLRKASWKFCPKCGEKL